MVEAKVTDLLLTLRRGYHDASGTVTTGYEYTYGGGRYFEDAFLAALNGEFQRAPDGTPTGRGWIEVEVRRPAPLKRRKRRKKKTAEQLSVTVKDCKPWYENQPGGSYGTSVDRSAPE